MVATVSNNSDCRLCLCDIQATSSRSFLPYEQPWGYLSERTNWGREMRQWRRNCNTCLEANFGSLLSENRTDNNHSRSEGDYVVLSGTEAIQSKKAYRGKREHAIKMLSTVTSSSSTHCVLFFKVFDYKF